MVYLLMPLKYDEIHKKSSIMGFHLIKVKEWTLINSIKVVSNDRNGTPLAETIKSKKETKPPFAAGLRG